MKQTEQMLEGMANEEYADFMSRLTPGISRESIIGVKTPELRRLAAKISKDESLRKEFLSELPHQYFEENQLHIFIISGIKSFDGCIEAVERFLPYIDNWATCDQLSPKAFKQHRTELLPYIDKWIKSSQAYTVRFAIKMLMSHFLDADFNEKYLYMVAAVKSDEYYVNMMISWYFATALSKQWDCAVKIIENRLLEPWTNNKAIQKALESLRITHEQKEYLKALKINRHTQI